MRRIAYLLALWGVLVLSSGVSTTAAARPIDKNQSSASEGSMNIQTSDDPSPHFFAARDAYMKRDYDACAKELRLAGDILKRDAAETKMLTAHELRVAGNNLDKLAERVQRGQVTTVDDLNDRIGQSYKALSDYHYQMARESYERNRQSDTSSKHDAETGRYLNAAANDLESWARYTGRTVEAGTRTAIDDTKSLAGKMISGAGWATERTGEAINNFGETIKGFGRRVENKVRGNPAPSAAPPVAPAPPNTPGSRY